MSELELENQGEESIYDEEETGTRTAGGYSDSNMVRDTNDDIFAAEFTVMMTYRKNNGGAVNPAFSIPKIPTPQLSTLIQTDEKKMYAKVLNIEEAFYSVLNDELVEVIKDRTVQKRKALNDGSYIKDEDGNVRKFDVKIDANSFVIRSRRNIKKSNYVVDENGEYKTNRDGTKVRYQDPEGFAYIDFEVIEGVKYYLYMIPKKYLYKANMTALVLSTRAHQSSYYGYKLAFVNGLYYYLCVIDYKREQNDNTTRVLGISDKVDFKQEIQELLQFWQANGKYKGKVKPYMFDIAVTEMQYASGKIAKNLGCMFFRGKLAMESYESRSFEPFGGEEEA